MLDTQPAVYIAVTTKQNNYPDTYIHSILGSVSHLLLLLTAAQYIGASGTVAVLGVCLFSLGPGWCATWMCELRRYGSLSLPLSVSVFAQPDPI